MHLAVGETIVRLDGSGGALLLREREGRRERQRNQGTRRIMNACMFEWFVTTVCGFLLDMQLGGFGPKIHPITYFDHKLWRETLAQI